MLNISLQNLNRIEHFEIYIFKLIDKLKSRKLMYQLNSNSVSFLFPKSIIRCTKNHKGVKGDWDFRISDLVKNPDGTDI